LERANVLCHEKVRVRTEIVVVAGKGKPFVPLVQGKCGSERKYEEVERWYAWVVRKVHDR
jgi:hypothetical protein